MSRRGTISLASLSPVCMMHAILKAVKRKKCLIAFGHLFSLTVAVAVPVQQKLQSNMHGIWERRINVVYVIMARYTCEMYIGGFRLADFLYYTCTCIHLHASLLSFSSPFFHLAPASLSSSPALCDSFANQWGNEWKRTDLCTFCKRAVISLLPFRQGRVGIEKENERVERRKGIF